MAQATAISPQALTNTAKALIQAYNDKDWDRVKAGITADFVYDEVPTSRKVTGIDATIEAWKGWAQAFPDSKGVFHGAHVAQDGIVVLEQSWQGTHQGTLQTPKGAIAATGKRIDVRACAIIQIAERRLGPSGTTSTWRRCSSRSGSRGRQRRLRRNAIMTGRR